jgi:hypothetical protein
MENPPKKYFRLSPGNEVRLRYSYLIKCDEVIKDEEGNIVELRCSYDPMSGEGSSSDGRRVKGVIHWVSAADAVEAEVRLFNNLFIKEDPNNLPEGMDWMELINPESMLLPPPIWSLRWPMLPWVFPTNLSAWVTSARIRIRPPRNPCSTVLSNSNRVL